MKIAIADQLAGILGKVNFYRFESKEIKVALNKNYLALRKIVKQATADQSEIVKKFQEDWKDEIAAVQKFRDAHQQVEGHEAYLKAEAEAVDIIQNLYDAEADITIVPVDMTAFVSELNGEITPEQLAILADNGFFAQE